MLHIFGGTRRIPIARPQVLVDGKNQKASVIILFRDTERLSRVSALHITRIKDRAFELHDLSEMDVGSWEPTFDPVRWQQEKQIHIFVQEVYQADGEELISSSSRMVYVPEWQPDRP